MRNRILLAIAAFLTIFQCSFAQSGEPKKQDIKLGLKLAPNLSFMIPSTTDYKYDGIRGGGTLGFVGDFYFNDHYAFSTGFNFMLLGGKLEYPSVVNHDTGTIHSRMSFFYVEVPVMIKMVTNKFGKCTIFGQIGFGTGFRLAAHETDDFETKTGKTSSEKTDISSTTTTIRESLIVGIGSEFYLDESTRLFLGLTYSNSLNNVLKGYNNISGKNQKGFLNYAELNLGILF